jgi:hypothetical protein
LNAAWVHAADPCYATRRGSNHRLCFRFPGEKKAASAYGPEAPASKEVSAPAAKEDEDDIDLFGSDEEEDAEAEKLKEQRLAEYRAKKAQSKKTKPMDVSNRPLDHCSLLLLQNQNWLPNRASYWT